MTDNVSASADEALARDLGLSLRSHGMVPAEGVSFRLAIAAGIAPLDEARSGFRIAISASDAALRVSSNHDLKHRDDVVVMPVAAFRTMLRDHAGATIADMASHDLEQQRPGQSAMTGMSNGQRIFGAIMVAALLACLLVHPQAALVILAILTIPIFAALLILRIGAVIDGWSPASVPALPMADAKLPIYTVLVPLYREAAVLDQLLAALLRIDYPPNRLDIKILVEQDDDATRKALAARALPRHVDVVVAPRGTPQTKPRALNIGLMEARGELLAIFDAEDRPDPRQLRLAANLFARHAPEVACLQGRLAIDNADDTLLTRMFALEYAALFDVINTGLIRAGAPVLLGGTSNHFRVSVLRQIGGWDAWNVTEDADLSFRLLRCGYRIADLPSATLEEAPITIRPWFNQRIRWMKGFLQTVVTHTRQPRELIGQLGWKNALVLLSLCGGTLLSALSYPLFIIATVTVLTMNGLPHAGNPAHAVMVGVWITMFAGGLVALLAPVILGAMHRGLTDLLWFSPLLPLYCLLVSGAAFAALVEYVRAPSRWNKTDHGLARTSRQSLAFAQDRRSGERTPKDRAGPADMTTDQVSGAN
jgi:cellulose synthase/poly-beta-1,6-N-acetylglucosamine synthase-like glycosyltransferase